MPSLVARHIPPDADITLHSENGLLHFGGPPAPGQEDTDLVDAGKNPVTLRPGAAFFDSALSFAMMRGGHLDIAVLGGFEVSATGDLANWWTGIPGDPQGVGGAMDLASGAKQIWVLMEHRTKDGRPQDRRGLQLSVDSPARGDAHLHRPGRHRCHSRGSHGPRHRPRRRSSNSIGCNRRRTPVPPPRQCEPVRSNPADTAPPPTMRSK